MIRKIELHMNSTCNFKCSYCFLDQASGEFHDWDKLRKFLEATELADEVDINLTSGELTLVPTKVVKAIKEIRKVERVKDVHFRFGLYSNGSKMENLIRLLDEGYLTPELVSISWDGVDTHTVRTPKEKFDNNPNVYKWPVIQLGNTIYREQITVRTAVTAVSMQHITKTLGVLELFDIKKWEYYFLLNYSKYSANDFTRKFASFMRVVFDQSKFIDIYNLETMAKHCGDTEAQCPNNWCTHSPGEQIYISPEGLIYPCGVFSKSNKEPHWKISAMSLDEPLDASRLANAIQQFCTSKCTDCDNTHCTRCTNVETASCMNKCLFKNLRSMERKMFLERMKE